MTTFGELIDQTLLQMSGFSTNQDAATFITQNITASDLQVTVNDSSMLSRGLGELNDELVWIDRVDQQNNIVYFAPWGRGYRGTTAASHAVNSRIAFAPLFPRAQVRNAINQTIAQVFPRLWATDRAMFTFQTTRSTYPLPAEAQDILAVSYDTIGPSREWLPIRRWRNDKTAALSEYPTGHTISIYDGITPGRTVQVFYTKKPSQLSNSNDAFSQTGLPDSCLDVIQYGAAYKLTPYLDMHTLSGLSAEADFVDNNRTSSAASTVGRYFFQLFNARLAEEADRLRNLYPVRSHYTL